jgi:hypothetical protein
MPYYDTIEQDLARAKMILAKGRAEMDARLADGPLSDEEREELVRETGGVIGQDVVAAYKLLESFVAEIERLQATVGQFRAAVEYVHLYDVAKQICRELGQPWMDPRTGVVHPPTEKVREAEAR